MSALIVLPLIFSARILDVSMGTLRTIAMIRGYNTSAIVLGFFEVTIWMVTVGFALDHIMAPDVGILWRSMTLVAYGGGYSSGIAIGMWIERKLALGNQTVRAIVRDPPVDLANRLRDLGYAVTRVEGHGRDGPVEINFIVVPRRYTRRLLDRIFDHAPHAFVTVEDIYETSTEAARQLKTQRSWASKLTKFK